MNEIERDELLIRLDERMDKVRSDQKDFKRTMEGKGFAACQLHAADLKRLKRNWAWSRNIGASGMIALVGKYLYSLISPA
jgi:hypothetical protein